MEYKMSPIFVKPYVYYYYQKSGLDAFEKKALKNLLYNPNKRDEARYSHWKPSPNKRLALQIPERWFNNGLHTLTATNANVFAAFLENKLKAKLEHLVMLELIRCAGQQITFQQIVIYVRDELLFLSEEEWPYDSIKKHLQRFEEKKQIKYSRLKKYAAVVPFAAKSSAKLPNGFLWLKDWLILANISERTWRNCFKREIPYLKIRNRVAVATADVL